MKAILEIKDATVSRGQTDLLKDLNWSVMPGENWVLLGPNGAGKTTLLNLLTGYLWPTSGSVNVLGETLGQVDVRDLRRTIAVVSDPVRAMLNEDLDGMGILVTGARAHLNLFASPSRDEIRRAEEVASQARCAHLLHRRFAVMSSGERQRLAIARALMPRPRLVILDEPCAALDLAARESVLATMESIASGPDAPAMIFATHHIEEIVPVFNRILLLQQGNKMAAGPLQSVLTGENLSRLFGVSINVMHENGRWAAMVERRPATLS